MWHRTLYEVCLSFLPASLVSDVNIALNEKDRVGKGPQNSELASQLQTCIQALEGSQAETVIGMRFFMK